MRKYGAQLSLLSMILLLSGCSNTTEAEQTAPSDTVSQGSAVTEASENAAESAVTEESAAEEAAKTLQPRSTEHEYVHGEEGYYNILEDGIDFELVGQGSGTCWVCASACALMTDYQRDHEDKINLDQYVLLDAIYDPDKPEDAEGLFVSKGMNTHSYGGARIFVINELSRKSVDGLVLDTAIAVGKNWSVEEIKDGLRRYGALYIGIPDTNRSKKGYHDNYYTMNYPDAEESAYDHSIAVLGWDDHFPKEYFNTEASQDGAWITYNSLYTQGYYYVSYDTVFDFFGDFPCFLSASKDYTKVLAYDGGYWGMPVTGTEETTTLANVFSEKGTLAAVGTYVLADDTDLTIQVLTPDLEECLYSQEVHVDRMGYYVFDLEDPMEVDEYAIAVTYPGEAPVEGEAMELDPVLRVQSHSEEGQSYLLQEDGTWLDLGSEAAREKTGFETNNACIRALYR